MKYFSIIRCSLTTYGRHIGLLTFFMLIAAIGRYLQLGGQGYVSSGQNIMLEIFVALSRVCLLLLVIGHGNVVEGVRVIKRIFKLPKKTHQRIWDQMAGTFRTKWIELGINILVFVLVVFLINFLIEQVASSSVLLETLQRHGLLHTIETPSLPIIFFLRILR